MSLPLILGIVAAVILIAVFVYNSLIRAKLRTDEAWSDITVQLKRRYDLIPNLVNTVQGYAKHEKSVFDDVTEARAQALNAQSVSETAKADNQFQAALKSLFAVAEAYPDLKANQGFQQLQGELVDTEDKIQAARRFYNGAARDFNIKIQSLPTSLFAGMLGFRKRDFFEVDEGESEAVASPVKVEFPSDKEVGKKA
jgi:LemA protein